jgi:cell division protein FtsB
LTRGADNVTGAQRKNVCGRKESACVEQRHIGMPPARHTNAARSERTDSHVRSDRHSRPREVQGRLSVSKVRWNRKVRLVMILVFLLVGWMAVDAAASVLSAHSQADSELALVQKYAQRNHRLEREAKQLTQPSYILRAARQLGMVKKGEQGYVIPNLKSSGH